MAAKSGGNADMGVMERHVVRPATRAKKPVEDLRGTASRGFGSEDDTRRPAELASDCGEFAIGKLMEDQVPDDAIENGIAGKRSQILSMPNQVPRPSNRRGTAVESGNRHAPSGKSQSQFAGPGAELEHRFALPQQRRQRAFEPAMIAEHAVDETQIAPVLQRVGMVVREGVE
jgi:hypothetical protein